MPSLVKGMWRHCLPRHIFNPRLIEKLMQSDMKIIRCLGSAEAPRAQQSHMCIPACRSTYAIRGWFTQLILEAWLMQSSREWTDDIIITVVYSLDRGCNLKVFFYQKLYSIKSKWKFPPKKREKGNKQYSQSRTGCIASYGLECLFGTAFLYSCKHILTVPIFQHAVNIIINTYIINTYFYRGNFIPVLQ